MNRLFLCRSLFQSCNISLGHFFISGKAKEESDIDIDSLSRQLFDGVQAFLGGWHLPFAERLGLSPMMLSILQILTFCVKLVLVEMFFIIVRWTIPRFRYDQLMKIGWKVMLPLTLANVVLTGAVLLLIQ